MWLAILIVMKKSIYNKDSRLESSRWFPYVAWVVVLGFSFFVYQLSNSLAAKKSDLESKQTQSETYLMPIDELRRQNISE